MAWEGGLAGWGHIDGVGPWGMKHSSLVQLRHWMKMVWAIGMKTR
jgi:hypothetical protein